MKHFTNKKTNEVYGYESIEVAKEYNDDFENLVEMTDEQFIDFRDNRPKGGQWTYTGWVIDPELLTEAEERNRQQAIADLQSEKAQALQQMQLEMLLGNTDLATEHAKRVKDIEAEIEALR